MFFKEFKGDKSLPTPASIHHVSNISNTKIFCALIDAQDMNLSWIKEWVRNLKCGMKIGTRATKLEES
jgi:hypothetical protein